MPSRVVALNACVDTLVLNIVPTDETFSEVKRRLDTDLQQELEAWKRQAQEDEEDIPTRFVFEGSNLLMQAKGGDGFNWIMYNKQIKVAVNRSAKMNLLAQVRFSSEYLQVTHDLGKCISDVYVFFTSIFGQYIAPIVSNLDLALDVIHLDLGTVQEIKERFLTRAQLDDEMPLAIEASGEDDMIDGPDRIKRRWRRITGLPFGARNANVSALLYDKTHEIKYKSKEKSWFYDKWLRVTGEDGQPVWDGESPVWRIEVRFKRPALREMMQEGVFHGINDAWELERRLPGLWSYAVGHPDGGADGLPDGWLRYVIPTEDTNRSRWPVHPDWQVIQRGFIPAPIEQSAYEQDFEQREEALQAVDEELSARPMITSHTPLFHRHASKTVRLNTDIPSSNISSSFHDIHTSAPSLKPFVRKRKRQVNLDRMVAQIAGCTVTAEAWRPTGEHWIQDGVEPDLSDTFQFLYGQVEAYLEEKGREFSKLVRRKRTLYSLETAA
jgi:hypothetical protein